VRQQARELTIARERGRELLAQVAKGLSRINSLIPVKGRAVNKNVTSQVLKYYLDKKKSEA
jgi:hypothetical protein